MEKPTEQVLSALEDAFNSIDYSLPNAHPVFEYLLDELGKIMTDQRGISWREFRFYALGVAYKDSEAKFITIPQNM